MAAKARVQGLEGYVRVEWRQGAWMPAEGQRAETAFLAVMGSHLRKGAV